MEISTLDNITDIVSQTETNQVEFKETTGQLERGMETLCAFLNGEGGTVLFGITDNGKIVGQDVSDSTKRTIAEAIQRMEPSAILKVNYISLPESEKKVIAISIVYMIV